MPQTSRTWWASTTRNASWELDGYSNYTERHALERAPRAQANYTSRPFYGYTQGPGYYGKTFFLWPPDPRRPLNTKTATAWSQQPMIPVRSSSFSLISATRRRRILPTVHSRRPSRLAIASSGQTSMKVASAGSFSRQRPVSCSCRIGNHAGNSGLPERHWTVTRAQDGTTATTYSSGNDGQLDDTGRPSSGIYTAAKTSSGYGKTPSTSQTWPWPNDGGTTLSTYLTTNVLHPRFHQQPQPVCSRPPMRLTRRSCASTTGTTWSTTWGRPPATGGFASSAPTRQYRRCSTHRRR